MTTEPDLRDVPIGLLHSKGWQIAMIGLGTATVQLDTSVNIAFPAITRGFDLTIGDIQWVVISYVLTYASLLLVLGRIGDSIGHAIVYRTGLIWSAVALLLVSIAPNYAAMLVFRCLQGVGAALVMSPRSSGSEFPSPSRRWYFCAACRHRRRGRPAIASTFWAPSH